MPGTPLYAFSVIAFTLQYPMWEAKPPAWYEPRVLVLGIANTMLRALFAAGLVWWVLAAVRGEEQSAAQFWEGIRRAFWPLFAWTVVLGWAVQFPLLLFLGRSDVSRLLRAALAVQSLILLPLVLTSAVIVVLRPPLYRAPAISARIFVRQAFVLLGFWIPFRLAYDTVWAFASAFGSLYAGMLDPQQPGRWAIPLLAFAMQVAKIAVGLTATTAFVILVARTGEEMAEPPPQPEAAPA